MSSPYCAASFYLWCMRSAVSKYVNGITLLATGGVDAGNAAAFLEAGAVAVAVGGNLIGGEAVARRDWADLTRRARELVAAVGR